MNLLLLPFGNARDAFGFSQQQITCNPEDTPLRIAQKFAPQLSPEFIRVALDGEFVSWDTPVGNSRELAFLPPVSGG